jgi:hypothetical protein
VTGRADGRLSSPLPSRLIVDKICCQQ